jgi:hypothetical protein
VIAETRGLVVFSSRRYHGRNLLVPQPITTSKPTPKAASSSTPTKASSCLKMRELYRMK